MDSAGDELRRVGAGLRLVTIGLIVVVVNAVAAIGVVMALGQPGKDPAAMIAALARDHPAAFTILIGMGVLSNVLAITGKAFCLAVPKEAGAAPFILMAVTCGVIGLALQVVAQVSEVGAAATELGGISPLFTMFGFIFFLRFLRRLATYLGSVPLLLRAARVQAGTVILFVVYLIASIGAAAGLADLVTLAVGGVILIGALILFVLYARLVHSLRRATEAAADAAA